MGEVRLRLTQLLHVLLQHGDVPVQDDLQDETNTPRRTSMLVSVEGTRGGGLTAVLTVALCSSFMQLQTDRSSSHMCRIFIYFLLFFSFRSEREWNLKHSRQQIHLHLLRHPQTTNIYEILLKQALKDPCFCITRQLITDITKSFIKPPRSESTKDLRASNSKRTNRSRWRPDVETVTEFWLS